MFNMHTMYAEVCSYAVADVSPCFVCSCCYLLIQEILNTKQWNVSLTAEMVYERVSLLSGGFSEVGQS